MLREWSFRFKINLFAPSDFGTRKYGDRDWSDVSLQRSTALIDNSVSIVTFNEVSSTADLFDSVGGQRWKHGPVDRSIRLKSKIFCNDSHLYLLASGSLFASLFSIPRWCNWLFCGYSYSLMVLFGDRSPATIFCIFAGRPSQFKILLKAFFARSFSYGLAYVRSQLCFCFFNYQIPFYYLKWLLRCKMLNFQLTINTIHSSGYFSKISFVIFRSFCVFRHWNFSFLSCKEKLYHREKVVKRWRLRYRGHSRKMNFHSCEKTHKEEICIFYLYNFWTE